MARACSLRLTLCCLFAVGAPALMAADESSELDALIARLPAQRGLVAVVATEPGDLAARLAARGEWTIYVQTPDEAAVAKARAALHTAGLLGTRVYVERGSFSQLQLADNLADAVIVPPADASKVDRNELLRVVNPYGKLFVGGQAISKPAAQGAGQWVHPYHGPDNNPQSEDRLARAPYRTQFLAEPWYVPFPEVTVTAGGRVFKAFGHVGYKKRDWPWLNKLVAFNGFNGTLLWQRSLEEGFNIHRNTMIATDDALYLADSKSCKLLDPATGEVKREIVIAADQGGPVWKWMALADGVLYALVGDEEPRDETLRDTRTGAGWPWKPMTRLYDDRNYRWGFGRTLLAIEPKTGNVLWRHVEEAPIDSRAVAMTAPNIYYYCDGRFLACLDARSGKPRWRNSDAKLLEAIGTNLPAQSWQNGFSTQVYMKSSEKALFFAGPQRPQLVAASADDGRLLWQFPHGNFQLVLRDEGLYAMGKTGPSKLFDPLTGEVKADLPALRGNCTRATGAVDCIYARGDNHGGTLRLTVPEHTAYRIPLMRPDCHGGVIVANGLMYWGPWMCDCNLSLVGIICLGPAPSSPLPLGEKPGVRAAERQSSPLTLGEGSGVRVSRFAIHPGDWPCYRADNRRSGAVPVGIPAAVERAWNVRSAAGVDLAAPIAAGGLVFISGSDGSVQARSAADGKVQWTAFTGGAIQFPPAVADGRLFVGSGDGFVYAFDAATGARLWRFRAAPADRKIMCYGRLTSTWPVAGGVLVEGGTLYTAAGLASYDGTYVYALDAATGRVKWANDDSGRLHAADHFSGVSVQGHLLLDGNKLYMAGGNVASPAVYDVKDGTCLNELPNEWVKAPRGRELYRIAGQVTAFERLLYAPKQYWPGRYYARNLLQADNGEAAVRTVDGQVLRVSLDEPDGKAPKAAWRHAAYRHVNAMALGRQAAVVAGQLAGDAADSYAVSAIRLDDGRELWRQPLPAMPVQWGLAIDAAGRLVVATEDGQTAVYAAREKAK